MLIREYRRVQQLTAIFTDCLVENIEDRVGAGVWRGAVRAAALLARESPRRLMTSAARAFASSSGSTRRTGVAGA